MFMICSMDMEEPHCEEEQRQPADPDLAWTQWALRSLAEVVDITLRTARMTAAQQQATPVAPVPPPDFALAQARLARSVRLTVAMSGRIRDAYREGKAAKPAPQRMPAEAPASAGAGAAAAPQSTQDRAEPREILSESETPEVEFEALADEEEPLDGDSGEALLPRDRAGAAAVEACDDPPAIPVDAIPAESRPMHGPSCSADAPGAESPTPNSVTLDSS
jgi:hypothetical protein